jgi:para-aminobenzoate synthetase/4-amino-4-deoxychorismate lyase
LKPFSDETITRLTSRLAQEDDFVLLESSRVTEENHRSLLFTRPCRHLICPPDGDAAAFLDQVDCLRAHGYFLAGWLSYEFGYLLEPRLRRFLAQHDQPLAVLGVYEEPLLFDHATGLFSAESSSWIEERTKAADSFAVTGLQTSISQQEYLYAVRRIQEYIRAGDTYQVNFTLHFNFSFHGAAAVLYRALRRSQSVAYSAWLRYQGRDILSFSPELFFRFDANGLRVRPMKGTLRRGRTNAEDEERQRQLHVDPKNRSENVMIVDLLRNDLGRLLHASGGGEVVPLALFEVEVYESLLQMTSTIDAIPNRPAALSFRQIIEALFPCGSITGAPKIRTMEIIRELEQRPRGVYCGAIGWMSQTAGCFNVPIRTVELEQGRGRMGIGSGIVADSQPEEEWEECLLKGNFLTKNEPDFQLIETLLWEPGSGFFLLDYHIERIADSARYFHFCCDLEEVRARLTTEVQLRQERQRVRLLLHRDGRIEITSALFPQEPPLTEIELPTVVFSQERVDAHDPHRFHKTTRRELYDQERSLATQQGFYEVLFINTAGQVTEGAVSNLFLLTNDNKFLLTPPIDCGLLKGTYRQMLLKQGKAVERVLSPDDVFMAKKLFVANSLRGLIPVHISKFAPTV